MLSHISTLPSSILTILLLSPFILDPLSSLLAPRHSSSCGSRAGGVVGVRAVTVYTAQVPASAVSDGAAKPKYTGLPAYDPITLNAPAPPSPPITQMIISLPPTEAALTATGAELSIKQKGNFLGFSIELSVSNSIMGSAGSNIKVPFLNYMANIRTRAGAGAIVRVGGNSQENSTIYTQGVQGGGLIDKIKAPGANVTDTPIINYSPDLLHLMANISSVVDVAWYFGLAFNASDAETLSKNVPVAAQYAHDILGGNLLGLQLGNEPDLYEGHKTRSQGYNVNNYTAEFDEMKQLILDTTSLSDQKFLVGPSVCCEVAGFELEDVYNSGWLSQNVDHLAVVSVQHYPENNCQINGRIVNAQDIFPDYLNHTSSVALVAPYLNGTRVANAAGKNMIMFEMNTASCGGFPGLSDSFGASLWMADYALQMAYRNFTTALMHVGGQNVYYNPFTPPSTSNNGFQEWTTGSVYYSALVVAETFGQSNQSQIVDISNSMNASIYHPAYAVYENGVPTRLALFNYVSDSTGASTYNAVISMAGTDLASNVVSVRYLQAASVTEKYNITWAGQTMGQSFSCDGRLYGNQNTVTINCDTNARTCTIPVYAPSMALVFLTPRALTQSSASESVTQTYKTSLIGQGSATVDPAVLSTSNGQAGNGGGTGATSAGSVGAAERRVGSPAMGGWVALLGGLVGLTLMWC